MKQRLPMSRHVVPTTYSIEAVSSKKYDSVPGLKVYRASSNVNKVTLLGFLHEEGHQLALGDIRLIRREAYRVRRTLRRPGRDVRTRVKLFAVKGMTIHTETL